MRKSLKQLKTENPVEYNRILTNLNTNARKWYNDNKHTDKYKQYRNAKAKRHYFNHAFKRLAKGLKHRDKNSTVTKFDIWKIAKRQKLKCVLTGRKLTNANISPDHIIPLSKGGNTTPENIRLVIKEVNLCRQAMTDEEFLDMCKSVVNHFTIVSRSVAATVGGLLTNSTHHRILDDISYLSR